MNSGTASSRFVRSGNLARVVRKDPDRWTARGAAAVFVLTLPALLSAIVLLKPAPGAGRAGADMTVASFGQVAAGGSASGPSGGIGAMTYASSCAVCHGPSGDGVKGLGKPLRNSGFVQSQTDEQLFDLVVTGRPVGDPANTTGALMPPRGAQGLGDEAVRGVVSYLRSMQEPGAPLASMAPWELKGAGGGAPAAAAVELTEHPGYALFVASCAACHGQGAQGMEGLGLPLTTSGFVRGKSDKDLITFIKMGRASWDENNTTGIDMPPKGGNPAITEEQLQSIVEYIRALQKQAMGS